MIAQATKQYRPKISHNLPNDNSALQIAGSNMARQATRKAQPMSRKRLAQPFLMTKKLSLTAFPVLDLVQ
jgi:hypothetical protein